MLETDCKVPVETVPIEPPESYTLYGIDHAVQVMRAQGLKKWQICKALHIGDDAWRDAIFEIRKQEMIEEMRGKRLTEEQRQRIVMLRRAGAKIREICVETGCPMSTVKRVLYADKPAERTQKRERTTQINQEFEDAVNEMIAQADEPIIMTEEHTAAPPDVVRKAVLYRIADIDDECSAAEAKINALREKIRDLTKERGELEIWMEEVKRNESTEA